MPLASARAALSLRIRARTGRAGGTAWRDLSPAASAWTLALLVAGSTAAYGLEAGAVKGIWILPDELIYGSLARSFAMTNHFALRGVSTLAYPIGYPFLIALAFVGRGPVAGYEAAKWLNAVLMSLASVPVFLLGRRLLPNWLALLCASLSLLIPSLAYTGVLMSENAAFPLFLLALLAMVRALEWPTGRRQLLALAAIAPVVAVRSEGLVLIPVLLGAIVLFVHGDAHRRRGGYRRNAARALRSFAVIGLVLPLSLAVLLLGEIATGRSPTAVLGRYADSFRTYPLGPTLRWSVYQVVDLELYLGVIPFVPAIIAIGALLWRAHVPRPQRAVAAVAAPAIVLVVLAAGATSSQSEGGPFGYPALPPDLHDRYCFYVAPLYLMFFLYWVHRRRDFSNGVLLPLLVAASLLPLVLPYASVHTNADFDALALLPWNNSLIANRNVHDAMAMTAALLAATLIPRRSSLALLQIGVVAALLWLVGLVARHDIASASLQVPTSRLGDRSWIDDSVPRGARVAVLWAPLKAWSFGTDILRQQALWRAEFFNPSVGSFFYVDTPMYYDLPATRAQLRDGHLVLPPGTKQTYRYLLVASPVRINGRVIGRDRRAGLTLYGLTPRRPPLR